MNKIIIYRAFDGEDFYSEEECIEYESRGLSLMHELFDKVQFYDEAMNQMLLPDKEDIEEYMEVFDRQYNNSKYVDIIEILSDDALNFVEGYMDLYLPEEVGRFVYDFDECEWKAI